MKIKGKIKKMEYGSPYKNIEYHFEAEIDCDYLESFGFCNCSEYQYKGNTDYTKIKNGLVGSTNSEHPVCWKCLKKRKEP